MTTENFQAIDQSLETEFHQTISKQKQIFTDAKIEEINKHTRPIQILLDQATEDGFIHNVKVDGDEVKKINIKEVHPPCKKITKVVENLKGFGEPKIITYATLQTRAKIEIDTDSVRRLQDAINKDRWDSHAMQIVLFKLPKNMRYQLEDGTWVIYGILNGNHRVKACIEEFQDFIPAWVTEINFAYLYKIANNIFNSNNNTNVPLTNEDHGNRIVVEIKGGETDFGIRFKACAPDAKEQCVRDEIKEIPGITPAGRRNVERYVQQNCKDDNGKKIYQVSSTIMNMKDAHEDTFAKLPNAIQSLTEEPDSYHTLDKNGNKNALWILIKGDGNEYLTAADKVELCLDQYGIMPTIIINTMTTVASNHDKEASLFKKNMMKKFKLQKRYWKSAEDLPLLRVVRIAKTSEDIQYCEENFQKFIDVE